MIYDGSEFPDEIFIPEDFKIISHSKLSSDELKEFDFSEFMAGKVTQNILEECQLAPLKEQTSLVHT